jgi:hypothetical protein
MARRAGTRNAYDLVRKLERDAAWRKREVVDLRSRVIQASGPWQVTLIRSGVVMLYAHWEAYTRYATQLYADFISEQLATNPVSVERLTPYFRSLMLYRRYQSTQGNELHRFSSVFKDYLDSDVTADARLDLDDLIERRGTVDEAEFTVMCDRVGLEILAEEQPRIKLIGVQLVQQRHAVAHGKFMQEVTDTEYLNYTDVLIRALDGLVNMLVDAATQRAYLVPAAA